MNSNYRTKPDMENAVNDLTVKKISKTGKTTSKQSVFEDIFWAGVAQETKKYKK